MFLFLNWSLKPINNAIYVFKWMPADEYRMKRDIKPLYCVKLSLNQVVLVILY